MTRAPHLQVPFQIQGASALVVEQDSWEEIAQNVGVILGTRLGARLVVPDFGISDPTFRFTPDEAEMISAVARHEERAVVSIDVETGPESNVRVEVGRA